jgi:N-acetyl-gamma-glutamyl-phosphate reductase
MMHYYESNSDTNGRKKVAIVGARGYSGLELARLVLAHPQMELKACFAGESQFKLSQYLPESAAVTVPVLPLTQIEAMAPQLDCVFLATPAEVSLELAPLILKHTKIIDLSGAFRLSNTAQYKSFYKFAHPNPELLKEAVYGLSPFNEIASARLISNPGCYATAVMMALVPLLKAKAIKSQTLVIDAKTGSSGAGRKTVENLLFTEVEGECLPYKVGEHQHLPEIQEYTARLSGVKIEPFFATHLIPVRRGILASIYAEIQPGANIEAAFKDAFANYPLARVGAIDGEFSSLGLSLKRVVGTARVHIQYKVVGQKLYLFSFIDNLLKGAASQALENFNQSHGFPVALGLEGLEGTL